MRIADITPGEIVRYGQAKSLVACEKTRTLPAIVLDVGPFTTVHGPCGWQVARLDKGPSRVVIARPVGEIHHRWSNFPALTPETEWRVDLVTPGWLMSMEEWNTKLFPIEERAAMHEVWERKRDRIRADFFKTIKRHVTGITPKGSSIGCEVHMSKDGLKAEFRVVLTPDQTRKLLGPEKVDAFIAHLESNPNTCRR